MRTTVFLILKTVAGGRRTLDSAVEAYLTKQRLPDRRDRGLATSIVYGVLRWQNTLDWYIRRFSKTPFHKISPDVRIVLRMGLFQLFYLDRVPDFAVVDAAVSLTRHQAKKPHLTGFVNGVLRNAARRRHQLPLPPDTEEAAALAVTKSFPAWLLERWIIRYGVNETKHLCDRMNMIPPVTVRVNTMKTNHETLRAALKPRVREVSAAMQAPDALLLDCLEVPVSELKGFKEGWFQVQDEAAQLVCRFMAPRPEDRVMDACAGLGGKTGYIAQLMKNRGEITAVDHDTGKLKTLQGDMGRLGVRNVITRVQNLLQAVPKGQKEQYDRIFADCPCSGAGVIRRNPDIKWSLTRKDLVRHQAGQMRILNTLAPMVRPGGYLIYAVCSREMEENEYVVHGFLNKHKEFDIEKKHDRPAEEQDPCLDGFVGKNGFYRTMPHPDGMDGFFGVRLRKRR
ncbi:MAG: 16S rRNA (cytosine(967)-C(5))-methyltransferase RsmB [Thermodesulfobacteriota bacterium]|nr:16S rRNA (cytosine(967)-C(5))-methyltransferase RsmB [Thermodesulfobacteriota bacterium]